MHVTIGPDRIASPESYPEWCDLGWFQNYRGLTAPVEAHYHDLPEIYLWHEGKGKALIDNKPVDLRPGVMAYTAAGAEHSISPAGIHSNTGLMPKPFSGCRSGHLHRDETGESPVPKHSSLFVMPEENSLVAPYELPSHCFVRHVISARLSNGADETGRDSSGTETAHPEGSPYPSIDGCSTLPGYGSFGGANPPGEPLSCRHAGSKKLRFSSQGRPASGTAQHYLTDQCIKRRTEAWTAILVREGRISVLADDNTLDLDENHLVIISAGVAMQIISMADSEIAMAEGWPDR